MTDIHALLVREIKKALHDEHTDLLNLYAVLQNEKNLEKSNIQQIIYQVALALNKRLFSPITKMELMHTEKCNLNCSYCFENRIHSKENAKRETIQKAIDLLFDYCFEANELEILHFGGEPTMNFPSIQFATEYAETKAASAGKNITFSMTTNGTLIREPEAEYLTRHRIRTLFSMDGCQTAHDRYRTYRNGRGTYHDVMKATGLMKEKGNWVGVKMTVSPENAGMLYDDVRQLHRDGINQFLIGHATGIQWTDEAMADYKEQMGRLYQWYRNNKSSDIKISDFEKEDEESNHFGCQAGRNSISISTGGEISPCSKLLALDNKKLICKLGDIHHGLYNIQNRTALFQCARLKELCIEKGIAETFKGGCYASNYEANNDIFDPCMDEHQFSHLLDFIHDSGTNPGNQGQTTDGHRPAPEPVLP